MRFFKYYFLIIYLLVILNSKLQAIHQTKKVLNIIQKMCPQLWLDWQNSTKDYFMSYLDQILD